jgi:hypothetical protein
VNIFPITAIATTTSTTTTTTTTNNNNNNNNNNDNNFEINMYFFHLSDEEGKTHKISPDVITNN